MKFKLSIFFMPLIVLGLAGCVQTPLDYKKGTKISEDSLQSFVVGQTTQATIVGQFGQPNRKAALKNKELWYFDFTRIGMLSGNVSEATVFEWDKNGKLLSFYKTGQTEKSGNPLIDAASGN